jgi:hypothetical protein
MRKLPKVTKESFLGVFRRRADSWRPWLEVAEGVPDAFWGAELAILAGADHINELEEWINYVRDHYPDAAAQFDEELADDD